MDSLWTEARGQQKQSNDPRNNQHNPQYANYWAPLTKAVGGGYCRLQVPLKLALAVGGTVAGHRLGALEGGSPPPPSPHAEEAAWGWAS